MNVFPRTIKELQLATTRELLRACVVNEMNKCTNVYSPKYKELQRLYNCVNSLKGLDKRVHDYPSRTATRSANGGAI